MRRWVERRLRRAHQDWTQARDTWHACQGTPWTRDAEVYLLRTRRRLDRWEWLYRTAYLRRDR